MCIIIVKPKGKDVKIKELHNCYENNNDGAGYMYVENGKIVIKKGFFEWNDFLLSYEKDIKLHTRSHFVIHFRIATSGNVDRMNCHPHRIDKSLAVAHNGIIDIHDKRKTNLSDTKIFIKKVLRHLPESFLENPGLCELISGYVSGSKLAFLRSNGVFHIINEDDGVWDKGIWFSNKTYKYEMFTYSTSYGKISRGNTFQSYFPECGIEDNENPENLELCLYCESLLVSEVEERVGVCKDCMRYLDRDVLTDSYGMTELDLELIK